MVRAKNHWSGFQAVQTHNLKILIGCLSCVVSDLGGETVECSHMGVTSVRRGVSIGVSVIITL